VPWEVGARPPSNKPNKNLNQGGDLRGERDIWTFLRIKPIAGLRTPCNCNEDYAYANGFPVLAQGFDVVMLRTSAIYGNMLVGWLPVRLTQSSSVDKLKAFAT
jgi:hypothetical protein